MALAAAYEIIEWWCADLVGGETGVEFLGSQGDIWDAQKDMLADAIGGLCGVLLYALTHENRKPDHPPGGRAVNIVRKHLTQLKNGFGTLEGSTPRIGQHHPPPGRLEQLVPQGALKIAHLGRNGLNRHTQTFGGTCKTTFFSHNPEIVQMPVIEHDTPAYADETN